MDSNWASENLQTIRTLMERSAIYRRALAPIMLSAGIIGIAAATFPCFVSIRSNRIFALYWMGVAFVAALTAFLLVRRQALRDQEPVWSPPTKRVMEALVPPFIAGFAVGALLIIFDQHLGIGAWYASAAWIVLYGCALSAAGFFTPRGLKVFGRTFVYAGSALLVLAPIPFGDQQQNAHYAMGFFFGMLHVICGIYLYFTERRRRA
jgi:hypothetical protein